MKNFIKKIAYSLLVLSSIFVLGIFFPLMVSIFVSIFTEITFSQCVSSVIFWVIVFIGWVISMSFINEKVKE